MLPEYTIFRNVFPSTENKTVSEEVEKEITNEVEEEKEEEESFEEYSATQLYTKGDTVGSILYRLELDTKKKNFILDMYIFVNLTPETVSLTGSYSIDESENILSLSIDEPDVLWNVEFEIIKSKFQRLEVQEFEHMEDYPPGIYSEFLSDIVPKPGLLFLSSEEESSEWCKKVSPKYKEEQIEVDEDTYYGVVGFYRYYFIEDENTGEMCSVRGEVTLLQKDNIFELTYRANNDEGTSLFYGTYKIANNKVTVSYDKNKYGNLGNIQFDIINYNESIGNMEKAYIRYSGDPISNLNLSKEDIFLVILPG